MNVDRAALKCTYKKGLLELAEDNIVPFFSGTTLTFSFVSETFLRGASATMRAKEKHGIIVFGSWGWFGIKARLL